MSYAATSDPLCYEGSSVLKNKAGIKVQGELDAFELSMFLARSDEKYPAGKLDYAHYKSLHKHLFQDVYEWAGEVRNIRIGKGVIWFCFPE